MWRDVVDQLRTVQAASDIDLRTDCWFTLSYNADLSSNFERAAEEFLAAAEDFKRRGEVAAAQEHFDVAEAYIVAMKRMDAVTREELERYDPETLAKFGAASGLSGQRPSLHRRGLFGRRS